MALGKVITMKAQLVFLILDMLLFGGYWIIYLRDLFVPKKKKR